MERNTRQRVAIRSALERAERPLTPREVLERAQGEADSIGIATVYRALQRFEEQGLIIPVHIPGDPARYEIAGKGHHHHFRCRLCGRVFEVAGCSGNLERLAPPGFKVESHEILLVGLCAKCR